MAHPRIDADVQMAHTGLSETEVSAPDAGAVFAHAVQSAGNKIYGCGRIHSGQIGFVSNESYAIHQVEAARKQIRQGVAPSYAIRNLMLKIGG